MINKYRNKVLKREEGKRREDQKNNSVLVPVYSVKKARRILIELFRGSVPAEVMKLEPFIDKWRAFGWWVTEINGHDIGQIADALDLTDNLYGDGMPKCIIAHTVKGKGIPQWEDRHSHYGFGPEVIQGIEEGRKRYG